MAFKNPHRAVLVYKKSVERAGGSIFEKRVQMQVAGCYWFFQCCSEAPAKAPTENNLITETKEATRSRRYSHPPRAARATPIIRRRHDGINTHTQKEREVARESEREREGARGGEREREGERGRKRGATLHRHCTTYPCATGLCE